MKSLSLQARCKVNPHSWLQRKQFSRMCGLALSLALLLMQWSIPGAQADGPVPSIDDIKIPPGLEYPGQPFDVEVWASNAGTDAEGGGSITISLPEGHAVSILESDVPILPEGWSDCDYSAPHAWVLKPDSPCHRALQHNTSCRGQVDLYYPLAETWHKPWRAGEKYYIKIRVFPRQDASYVTVYVRLAMRAGTRGCDLRLEPNAGSATGVDQQGFPVKALVVAVSMPTPTSTPPSPSPTATQPPPPTPTTAPRPPTPVPPTPTSPAVASPTATRSAGPAPGIPPAEGGGVFSGPVLRVLVGFVLVVFLLLVIIAGGITWRGSRQPGPSHLAGGGSSVSPPRRPLPPSPPLKPKCLQCGTGIRADALFCRSCGAPVPLIAERYPILRRLGQGGMGSVYLVRDERIPGKRWAMKEMSDTAIANPVDREQAISAFQREAQLLAAQDHPNLPRVADFFSEGGCHYLVMDFVEGETLESVLSRQATPFSEAEVLDWACQLCDVLCYLHAQRPPVIFRDLKPGNIMLARDGRLKLIDFGIARFFKPGQPGDTVCFGTPGYSPPEQYGRGQTDHRSDIYALGVTLHQLLTNHDPAATPFALPKVRQLNPSISPGTEAAINRATQLNPTRRFQSISEMKQALGIG